MVMTAASRLCLHGISLIWIGALVAFLIGMGVNGFKRVPWKMRDSSNVPVSICPLLHVIVVGIG